MPAPKANIDRRAGDVRDVFCPAFAFTCIERRQQPADGHSPCPGSRFASSRGCSVVRYRLTRRALSPAGTASGRRASTTSLPLDVGARQPGFCRPRSPRPATASGKAFRPDVGSAPIPASASFGISGPVARRTCIAAHAASGRARAPPATSTAHASALRGDGNRSAGANRSWRGRDAGSRRADHRREVSTCATGLECRHSGSSGTRSARNEVRPVDGRPRFRRRQPTCSIRNARAKRQSRSTVRREMPTSSATWSSPSPAK